MNRATVIRVINILSRYTAVSDYRLKTLQLFCCDTDLGLLDVKIGQPPVIKYVAKEIEPKDIPDVDWKPNWGMDVQNLIRPYILYSVSNTRSTSKEFEEFLWDFDSDFRVDYDDTHDLDYVYRIDLSKDNDGTKIREGKDLEGVFYNMVDAQYTKEQLHNRHVYCFQYDGVVTLHGVLDAVEKYIFTETDRKVCLDYFADSADLSYFVEAVRNRVSDELRIPARPWIPVDTEKLADRVYNRVINNSEED